MELKLKQLIPCFGRNPPQESLKSTSRSVLVPVCYLPRLSVHLLNNQRRWSWNFHVFIISSTSHSQTHGPFILMEYFFNYNLSLNITYKLYSAFSEYIIMSVSYSRKLLCLPWITRWTRKKKKGQLGRDEQELWELQISVSPPAPGTLCPSSPTACLHMTPVVFISDFTHRW